MSRIVVAGPGYGASIRRKTVSSSSNGLLNNLIAYWPLNEASGNALDLHSNGLTLTDTNTVTNSVGTVYATARQFTKANTEYFTRPGDDALLSTGDVDFTVAAWCYLDTVENDARIVSKWVSAGGQREYQLVAYGTDNRYLFQVRNSTDTTTITATANNYGNLATTAWCLVVGWHDATANAIYISINNGTADSAALSGGVLDTATKFRIGIDGVAGALTAFNGRIGPVMFWKSAAGGGGVLTAAQRTALYNSGAGLAYAAFTI